MENNEVRSNTQKLTQAEKAAMKIAKATAHRMALTLRCETLCSVLDVPVLAGFDTASAKEMEAVLANLKAASRNGGDFGMGAYIQMARAEEGSAETTFVGEGGTYSEVYGERAEEIRALDNGAADELAEAVDRLRESFAVVTNAHPENEGDGPLVGVLPSTPRRERDAPATPEVVEKASVQAVLAAIRADKKIGVGSGSFADSMDDAALACHLDGVTKGRGCTPQSAVTYYRNAQKKLANVQAAA